MWPPAELTTFFLVRHALCDSVGVTIAGRVPGISLNDRGKQQVAVLADRLAGARCTALYSSPLERATETALALAERTGLHMDVDEAFSEIDFGSWSGEPLAVLEGQPQWRRFNELRSWAAVPGGELMLAAQSRAIAGLTALHDRHRGARVAVVSHADIIRSIVAYAAGAPLDLMSRFECEPASVTVIAIGDANVRILRVNDSGSLSDP